MSKTTKKDAHKRAMIKAMETSLGIVTDACLAVGINRSTHYRWMEEDPDYKSDIERISDAVIDFVESQLHKRIKEGSDVAILFFLKCKAKSRGYIQSSELDVNVTQVPPLFPDDEG